MPLPPPSTLAPTNIQPVPASTHLSLPVSPLDLSLESDKEAVELDVGLDEWKIDKETEEDKVEIPEDLFITANFDQFFSLDGNNDFLRPVYLVK